MEYFEAGRELHKERQGKNWSYLFKEEKNFSQLGYKLIQPPNENGLLHCAKVHYNGNLKLIYLTEDYRNLPYMLASLQENGVWTIFYKLLSAILKIRENGFLSCTNIDITPECIYFTPKTLEPHLIYLPLATDGSEDGLPEFEQALRRNMIQALQASDHVGMKDGKDSMIEILSDTGGGLESLRKKLLKNADSEVAPFLLLQCKNDGIPITFEIYKDKYLIGRKRDNDGVLDCSNKVSRVHCSIVREDNLYYITDEQSSCGTFINEIPCASGERKKLHDGDVVRLADIEFYVKMQTR